MPELDENMDAPAVRGTRVSGSEAKTQRGRTGPTTGHGKARSSQNSRKHGCCSKALLLPDEDPQEQADLFQMWLDDYNPTTGPAMMLVREVATSHWLLIRQRRRYQEAEHSIYAEQPDAMDWTPEQHKRLQLFTRYLTTAERRFNKALSQLEAMRNNRIREGLAKQRIELQQAELALKRERLAQNSAAVESKPESSSKDPAKEKQPEAPEFPAAALFHGPGMTPLPDPRHDLAAYRRTPELEAKTK